MLNLIILNLKKSLILPFQIKVLILSLLLILSSCKKPNIPQEKNASVKATLLKCSKSPTIEEIAPYTRALRVCEFTALENNKILNIKSNQKIHVAHWAIFDNQILENFKNKSSTYDLNLINFNELKSIKSQPINNDFDSNHQHLYFHILSEMPKFIPKDLRFDYAGNFTKILPVYFKIYKQLNTAILGNSHTHRAINANSFSKDKNIINSLYFTDGGSGLQQQIITANKYLLNLPNLKLLVWGISPRNLNIKYNGKDRLNRFLNSYGYKHDLKHGIKFENNFKDIFNKKDFKKLGIKSLSLKNKNAEKTKLPKWAKDDSRWHKYIDKKASTPRFKFDEAVWQEFIKTLDKLEKKNIKVCLFVPPVFPLLKNENYGDLDGSSVKASEELISKLDKISKNYKNIFFLPYKYSENIPFKHFLDLDHLNGIGANDFTNKLKNYIKAKN